MKFGLCFALFASAVHMLDAARHYWHDDEVFSAGLNLAFGVTAALAGLLTLFV